MALSSPSFQQAFVALNPAQKQAVETLYGPVLVIAGPGTGKTQVLAMRIANILIKTDIRPESILALTFTTSGTAAMQRRLLELIGPTAHSVRIATFHSFCQDLIGEFSEKFLFAKRLQAIEDIGQIQILQEILTNETFPHLRPYRSPHFFLKDILRLIGTLKKEGVTPDQFLKILEGEKQAFETIPETEVLNSKTGKMKQKYADQLARLEKNFELQRLFARYQEKLAEEGFYDFEDMIMSVLNRLKTDESFLWTLRERFLFLLVDEFQDTNGAQLELVRLFAGEAEQPNVFAVGDDDQSIYRFQGASLENILTFQEIFPESALIFLTENYRSHQEILDASAAVIGVNTERLVAKIPGLQKDLQAVKGASHILPQMQVFAQRPQEHFFLAEKIKALHVEENIPYAEIAVLVRSNAEGFLLLEFFKQQGLPASFSGQGNALDASLIRQLRDLLGLIQDPEDDALFFRTLHFRFLGMPIESIWNLWRALKEKKETPRGKFWNFWQTQKNSVGPSTDPAFQLFCEYLERWQYDLHTLALPEFFQKVCTESGLLDALLRPVENAQTPLPSTAHVEELNQLNAFFAELTTFAAAHRNASLGDFLARLELREEFGLPLPERDIGAQPENVQILTAHKAKGLEFTAVFIVHAEHGKWGDQRHVEKITLPEGLLHFAHDHDPNEEERRLFYVAMTRAKKYLFFTRSNWDVEQREKAESRFISEISPDLIHVEEKAEDGGENTAFAILKSQLQYVAPENAPFPTDFLREELSAENFALSHSAFENFRENPQKFLWENVLRIPQVTPPSAALGIALHRALEELFQFPPAEQLMEAERAFRNSLRHQALTEKEYIELEHEGLTCLHAYLQQYQGALAPALHTEFNFRSQGAFLDGEIPLTGKVDKIEWLSPEAKTVRIVDYKFTAPRSENEIRGARESDQRDITAGRYFRQLVFYSLLCDFSPRFPYRAEEFEIDFLMPGPSGALKKLSFLITPEEKETLKAEIRLVWKKIQQLDFRPINLWGEEVGTQIFNFL